MQGGSVVDFASPSFSSSVIPTLPSLGLTEDEQQTIALNIACCMFFLGRYQESETFANKGACLRMCVCAMCKVLMR